jgi:hypothetical protein
MKAVEAADVIYNMGADEIVAPRTKSSEAAAHEKMAGRDLPRQPR